MSTGYSQVPVLERRTEAILWVYQESSSWTLCIPFALTVTVFILHTLFPVGLFRTRIHSACSSASPLWRHLMRSQGRDMKKHRSILGQSSEFWCPNSDGSCKPQCLVTTYTVIYVSGLIWLGIHWHLLIFLLSERGSYAREMLWWLP